MNDVQTMFHYLHQHLQLARLAATYYADDSARGDATHTALSAFSDFHWSKFVSAMTPVLNAEDSDTIAQMFADLKKLTRKQ